MVDYYKQVRHASLTSVIHFIVLFPSAFHVMYYNFNTLCYVKVTDTTFLFMLYWLIFGPRLYFNA